MLGERIAADLDEFEVPGASWVVFGDGAVTETGTAGVVEAGSTEPVTPETLFQAASISKPIAVLAMLRLVDRGLLDLDEDVNRKLRSWQVPPTGRWQPAVTLRQLASHSAGLTVSGFPGYPRDAVLPTTVQILDGVRPATNIGVRVDLVPGIQFRYSGGGTTVIQQLLEDVTRTPFRELMQELVLQPLGMSDSDYAQPLPAELHGRAARGHDDAGRPLAGMWDVYPQLAAAGLWTTPTDLAKFAIGVQHAYADGGLLSVELAREMLTPQIAATSRIGGLNHLGLGLFLDESGVRYGHSGGNAGFCCHLLAYRDTRQGAVVMTNGDSGMWVVLRAFAAVASTYGWKGYPQELEQPDLPVDATLNELAGRYRLAGGPPFVVRPRGRGLEARFGGQAPLVFQALSATRFAAAGVDAQLEVRDGGLVLQQAGTQVECVRE
ncbi:serine hydrolase domain-containing protein [Kribbella shirazensis]|uniref:CubicO group peptidase (Beta-lactamase class C family) n=1 Tax=Kribbella shirazensis TaxID=1105143 RepID=A0A7X5VBM8_9ACTN|nr:serine hydrolase domain-containing protein [Kribbella shirazensis]NIK58153.1 CubicO group peptidase (beta-lactamase class C family) [Kribbella shirazensis]